MDPQADNGWLDHVTKADHLFLKNIYDQDQMKKMEIENLEDYRYIIYRLLNIFEELEEAFESRTMTDTVMDFLRGDLSEAYETFEHLREDIEKIQVPKKPFARKTEIFKEKMLAFLYSGLISFPITDKIKGLPISQIFISNTVAIMSNKRCIHHSHITGEVFGYAHGFSNERVRENYYKIPVIAHNLFRFDFFFLAKGLRASICKKKIL